MRKLLFVFMFFMPMLAIAAVDISDCNAIGHQRGTLTEKDCVTEAYCNQTFADFPDDLDICLKGAKNQKECRDYIEEQNKKIEKNNLVYRCPMTNERAIQKNKKKTHVVKDLVYANNMPISQDLLANDTRYAYIFHAKTGFIGFVNHRQYSIIGAPEEYGLNMAIVDE